MRGRRGTISDQDLEPVPFVESADRAMEADRKLDTAPALERSPRR